MSGTTEESTMIRIFAIKFEKKKEIFDDEQINKFIMRKKIINIEKEFFTNNDNVYWTVFIEYDEILPEESKGNKEEGLNEWQNILFQILRKWRKEKADKEGIPVFLIATNKEFKSIVLEVPETLEKLKNIRGFGSKKIEKYGKDIVKIIKNYFKKK